MSPLNRCQCDGYRVEVDAQGTLSIEGQQGDREFYWTLWDKFEVVRLSEKPKIINASSLRD